MTASRQRARRHGSSRANRLAVMAIIACQWAFTGCGNDGAQHAHRQGFEQGRAAGYQRGFSEGHRQALREAQHNQFFWHGAGGFLTGFIVALAWGAYLFRDRLQTAVRHHVNRRRLKRHGQVEGGPMSDEAMKRVMPVLNAHSALVAELEGRQGALAGELYRRLIGALVPVPQRALDLGSLLTSLEATRAAFPQPAHEVERSLRLLKSAKADLTDAARQARQEHIRVLEDRARQLASLDENLERVKTKLQNIETFLGNLAMEVSQWSLVEHDGSLANLPVDVSRDIDRLAAIVREKVRVVDPDAPAS